MAPLEELEQAYLEARLDPAFQAELKDLLANYAGRPTPLYHAKRLSEMSGGAKIYIKREDLLHTGAHKINNCLGQALLARRMGKKRIIAETGAGQHGVATRHGLRALWPGMHRLHGRRGHAAAAPERFPHADARRESGRRLERQPHLEGRHQRSHARLGDQRSIPRIICSGSALGAHPYPMMVRDFHRVIGEETRRQILEREHRLPDSIFACVGGGSNAIGMFHAFLGDAGVRLIGVEAGGRGAELGAHAARFSGGSPGVLHGAYSYLLQDADGQVALTHSVSAGLDYALVGPEHAWLRDQGRAEYCLRHRSGGARRRADAGAHRRNYSRARIGARGGRSAAPRARRQRASCSSSIFPDAATKTPTSIARI